MPKTRSSIITSVPHWLPFQPKYDSAMVKSLVGIRPEPAAVGLDGLGGDAHHFLGVVFVLGKGIDVYRDGSAGFDLCLAAVVLVAGTAEEGEVAHAVGLDLDLPPVLAGVAAGDDGPGAGDLLIGRQGRQDVVDCPPRCRTAGARE